MKERDEKRSKKLRNLIILSFLCALVLGVSTYAWFIGMKTVNVSKFEVKVATTEGLYISLDAESWAYNLDITSADPYDDNTNKINGVELIPVSTIGDMDKTSSTMIMFEKGSLTAQTNGYRLLASRVNNYAHTDDNNREFGLDTNSLTGIENPEVEKTGYLAFDLFIKNVSGEEYYIENNKANEEAIYLTTNSKVGIGQDGIAGTGIENSVRVAFALIGRVEDVTSNYGDKATHVTCADVGHSGSVLDSGFAAKDTETGICRIGNIWEPNDMDHVDNAKNWYLKSVNATTDAAWDDLKDENGYISTYAVKDVIEAGDGIEIYTRTEGAKLKEYDYFTDTEKMLVGTERQEFMSLAPNSITKVRVYVYLEGQDIDNYDFASLGKQISINFGFTKERFQETDIEYQGPNTYITPTDSATVTDTNGTEIENGRENSYPVTGSTIPTDSAAYR